jgi:hypothetical protein
MSDLKFIASDFPFPTDNPPEFQSEKEEFQFDATKHIQFEKPEYIVDLNFDKINYDTYIANKDQYGPLAFSSPFKVLSLEGVSVMRGLVSRYQDRSKLKQSHSRIPLCIRGLGYISPFIREMNECSIINEIVSTIAREELCAHGMPMNYGHVNVGIIGNDRPVDAWHIDSVDYVMVIILSNMTDAKGGALQVALQPEAKAKQLLREKGELREGDEMMTVSYPGAGYAIVMQGSQILHHVTNVETAKEPRISLVNSYMRRNVFGVDGTKYSLFADGDPKHISGLDFARMKAWRIKGMMDYLLSNIKHTDDSESYLCVLDRAKTELEETTELIRGTKFNSPGFFDEVKKMETKLLHSETL